jgi:beta-galactosidase GanA
MYATNDWAKMSRQNRGSTMTIQRVFSVDGKPFFPLGGQVHNSSSYMPGGLERAWQALAAIHANTAEIPVYWEQVEPEEGHFDFNSVDAMLTGARAHGLRLILLWFGTWKNGTMKYAPGWVKRNQHRFWRVIAPGGNPLSVLSSHCEATCAADRQAFCALMSHLHQYDAEGTVIAIQIENEPGTIGSDRDYGPEPEQAFTGAVPPRLIRAMEAAPESPITAIWRRHGALTNASWPEMFGREANELFASWRIARNIDNMAKAGKEIHPIPMYVNAWLREAGWRVPGLTYPSGGPTSNVLDLWKWATPNVDLIAPDIYISSARGYADACAIYARPDNPLFIPESGRDEANALNMFRAIGNYHAVGYATFGVESLVEADGTPRLEAQPLIESFRSVAAVLPLLLAYQGTGNVHAVVQDEFMAEQFLDLGDYLGLVRFANAESSSTWRDYRHDPGTSSERGRGFVVQTGPDEFYCAGIGFRLLLKKKSSPGRMLASTQTSDFLASRLLNYLLVEEGRFNADGSWQVERRRSGDESDFGLWVTRDSGVVHAILAD